MLTRKALRDRPRPYGVSIIIVHLSPQRTFLRQGQSSVGAIISSMAWSPRVFDRVKSTKNVLSRPRGSNILSSPEKIQCAVANSLDNFTQDHETEIAVETL